MSKELRQPFYDTSFTLKGRIFHPNLLTTRERKNAITGASRDVFDVMFAWNPQDPANAAAYAQLLQFMEYQRNTCFPGVDPRAIVNPIKSSGVPGWPDYVKQDYSPNAAYLNGHHWINAETGKDRAPTVVMENRQPVMAEAEVYSGRNAVLNFSLYPMLFDPQNRQKKIGFGVNLAAVMLLNGGDKEGGKTQVDIGKVFGGFAQDMGIAPQFGAPNQFQGMPAPQTMPQQQNFQQGTTNVPQFQTPQTAPTAAPTNGQQPPWMNNGQNFNPGNGQR